MHHHQEVEGVHHHHDHQHHHHQEEDEAAHHHHHHRQEDEAAHHHGRSERAHRDGDDQGAHLREEVLGRFPGFNEAAEESAETQVAREFLNQAKSTETEVAREFLNQAKSTETEVAREVVAHEQSLLASKGGVGDRVTAAGSSVGGRAESPGNRFGGAAQARSGGGSAKNGDDSGGSGSRETDSFDNTPLSDVTLDQLLEALEKQGRGMDSGAAAPMKAGPSDMEALSATPESKPSPLAGQIGARAADESWAREDGSDECHDVRAQLAYLRAQIEAMKRGTDNRSQAEEGTDNRSQVEAGTDNRSQAEDTRTTTGNEKEKLPNAGCQSQVNHPTCLISIRQNLKFTFGARREARSGHSCRPKGRMVRGTGGC